jgi:hypothetical protein
MSDPITRSRRALLVAAASTAAVTLGLPVRVRAADGEAVLTGGEYTSNSVTKISNASVGDVAIWGAGGDTGSTGVKGTASGEDGIGIFGQALSLTGTSHGVYGLSKTASGAAVQGVCQAEEGYARGVYGTTPSTSGMGVHGYATAVTGSTQGVLGWSDSTDGMGVHGLASATSGGTVGAKGISKSPDGYGVIGSNEADSGGAGVYGGTAATSGETAGVIGQVQSPDGYGILGDTLAGDGTARALVAHAPRGTGVVGWAGDGSHPAGRAATGVFGYSALDVASVGVRGESPTGIGVQAVSGTGYAVRVSGKARFNRSGKVSVPKSRNYVDVTVPGGIASNTVVNATIQMYRAGVAVAGVRLNYPISGKARIYLTKVASTTSSTPVAWMAIETG